MPHVEIDATGIRQEPAVTRRFIVPAVMQVQHALPLILWANQVGEWSGRSWWTRSPYSVSNPKMRFNMALREGGFNILGQQSPKFLRCQPSIFRRSRLIPIQQGTLDGFLCYGFSQMGVKDRRIGCNGF